MIANQTTINKKDLAFSMKHGRKEKRVVVGTYVVMACGAALIILGGFLLYRSISDGSGDPALGIASLIVGALFLLWRVFYNKFLIVRYLKLPSFMAPRKYDFLDDCVLCRHSLDDVESEDRFEYSTMNKYFEQNNALYISLTLDGRERFLAVHNDSYSEGSAEELKALLESRGIHK